MAVAEPKVFYRLNQHMYKSKKQINDVWHEEDFRGDKAIPEAQKDLELCYRNVLSVAHSVTKKSIAFPSLGMGIPKKEASFAAITAVLEFIKNNPDKYDSIEFVIKNRTEFSLYKALLDQKLTNTTAVTNNVSHEFHLT